VLQVLVEIESTKNSASRQIKFHAADGQIEGGNDIEHGRSPGSQFTGRHVLLGTFSSKYSEVVWNFIEVQDTYILVHLSQGINEILLDDEVDWLANMGQKKEIIPSTPYKPEVEAKMKEIIQETRLNEVCNEAYDELLTQEFNSEQEDLEGDVV
jgi:hypothetical protein